MSSPPVVERPNDLGYSYGSTPGSVPSSNTMTDTSGRAGIGRYIHPIDERVEVHMRGKPVDLERASRRLPASSCLEDVAGGGVFNRPSGGKGARKPPGVKTGTSGWTPPAQRWITRAMVEIAAFAGSGTLARFSSRLRRSISRKDAA
jgi:hypothetical protein